MNEVTLENFRCFRGRQTARLAPLTLLVGENSTGKTSFLAMIRALWDLAYGNRVPDFKEDPYDLGAFADIAHHRGARGSRAASFEAGFTAVPSATHRQSKDRARRSSFGFHAVFGRAGTAPVPVVRRLMRGPDAIEERYGTDEELRTVVRTGRGSWEVTKPDYHVLTRTDLGDRQMWHMSTAVRLLEMAILEKSPDRRAQSLDGSPEVSRHDLERLEKLSLALSPVHAFRANSRPFASAPVRSRPKRSYEPSQLSFDPEGDYIPMLLATLYFQNEPAWLHIRQQLEAFGRASGLFDELSIRPLGKTESETFQVRIRKSGSRLKGPRRNLVDVGYGVSQILPLLTELFRLITPPIFLLQQPEVHLHPRAQAALGTLFCHVATQSRRLVVETHSDYLINRIRLDIRDRKTDLTPEDVSILFFERQELDVRIHSIRLDGEGNVRGAPDSYRRFFMEEQRRTLGL